MGYGDKCRCIWRRCHGRCSGVGTIRCNLSLISSEPYWCSIIADTFMPIELFSLAAVIYLSMIFIITRIFMLIEYWLMAPMTGAKVEIKVLRLILTTKSSTRSMENTSSAGPGWLFMMSTIKAESVTLLRLHSQDP